MKPLDSGHHGFESHTCEYFKLEAVDYPGAGAINKS